MSSEHRFLVKTYPRNRRGDAFALCDILIEAGLEAWVNELSDAETDSDEEAVQVTVPEEQAEQAGQALLTVMEGADNLSSVRIDAEIRGYTGQNLCKIGKPLVFWGAVSLLGMLSFGFRTGYAFAFGGIPLITGTLMWLAGSRQLASSKSVTK